MDEYQNKGEETFGK